MPAAECREDLLGQQRVLELIGREVDRQDKVRVPVGGIGDRLAQQAERQVADEAQILGQWDERVGFQQSAGGMVPARQNLEAEGLAAGEVDQRLIMGNDGAGADGVAQVGLQRGAGTQGLVDGGIEKGVAGRLARLGPVHGQVGALEQGLAVGCVLGKEGYADAGPDLDSDVVEVERLRERGDHAVGEAHGVLLAGTADRQAEFVTADAGEDVLAPRQLLEAFGDGDQQPVAGLVAVEVVDRLEAVEVEQQDGKGRAGALRLAQGSGRFPHRTGGGWQCRSVGRDGRGPPPRFRRGCGAGLHAKAAVPARQG